MLLLSLGYTESAISFFFILILLYIFEDSSYMIPSSPLVLSQESFALQGHLAVAGDIFGCHHLVDIKWDAGKYGTI